MPELTSLFSSLPLAGVVREGKQQLGQGHDRTAGVMSRLVELVLLHEAAPLQRIKMNNVVLTVLDAVFLTTLNYSCFLSYLHR